MERLRAPRTLPDGALSGGPTRPPQTALPGDPHPAALPGCPRPSYLRVARTAVPYAQISVHVVPSSEVSKRNAMIALTGESGCSVYSSRLAVVSPLLVVVVMTAAAPPPITRLTSPGVSARNAAAKAYGRGT
jgi:hypothetical protein